MGKVELISAVLGAGCSTSAAVTAPTTAPAARSLRSAPARCGHAAGAPSGSGSGGAFAAAQQAAAGVMMASAARAVWRQASRRSVARQAFVHGGSVGRRSISRVGPRLGGPKLLTPAPEELLGIKTDKAYNVPESLKAKLGKNLLLQKNHPLGILWEATQEYMKTQIPEMKFYDQEVPIVSTKNCFDDLRVEPDHPSRSPSDTYYVNADTVMRTHTSAHQTTFMANYPETTAFLCAGDVYRRDEIDASHYPVFHQCEGVRLYDASTVTQDEIKADLKKTLEGLAAHLFQLKVGEKTMKWLDEYFPFTEPSFELEIFYNEDWMEVLGCGVIHPDVIRNAGLDPEKVQGWAFGLGLERLAMVLFDIPDIRLFWSEDPRFSEQFSAESFKQKIKFNPFSKYPPVQKDISMWIPEDFQDNDFFEVVRDQGGDQVEKVDLMDEFTNPKTGRKSKMFRVTWRDMSQTLTNEYVNAKHQIVLDRIVAEMGVELR